MKKTSIIILLVIGVVAAVGYFFYKYWVEKDILEVWQLVPENAVLVYETDNAVEVWNELQETSPWQNLTSIPFYQNMKEGVEMLDSISGKKGQLDRLLRGKPFLFSLHITGRYDFDFIFYIELKSLHDLDAARNIVERLKQNKGLKSNSREYRGFNIMELKDPVSGHLFSYIFYKNYFLGSYTPFLVEDAIRNLSVEEPASFFKANPGLNKLAKLGDENGNIYINFRPIPQLLSVFSKSTESSIKNISRLGRSAMLEVTMEKSEILLNGFTLLGNDDWLQIFQGLKPQPLKMKYLLPDRTALFYHFTFDDAVLWGQNLYNYRQKYTPDQINQWEEVKNKYKFDLHQLFEHLGNEIGLSVLESIDINNPNQLVILHTKNIEKAVASFTRLAENISFSAGDTLYHERFGEIEIRQLDLKEFPALLLGPVFKGFEQCFYAPVDDYLVIGNSIQAVKNQLKDIELEDTWGRSVRQNVFLESTLKEANVSLMINTARAYEMLTNNLSANWKKFFRDYNYQMKQFEMAAIQFSGVKDKFYTSINIHHAENTSRSPAEVRYVTIQTVNTGSPIITKPFVVKNHLNNHLEVFVQDSAHVAYLIGQEGEILWKDSIHAPIIGDVTQIDFFNNGNLQYFFATEHALHLMDREGNEVLNYPLLLPDISIAYAAVIDYDNSKRYRFLLADTKGNLYMYNKEGENMEGWQPRKLGHRLSSPPFHLRVRGKDYLVAVQENGMINVMNRRGEMYSGFPVDLTAGLSSALFTDIGTNLTNTLFTTVTSDGMLVQFDLQGKILEKEQLYRPTRETTFRLIPDATGRSYVISRQGARRTGILSRKGELLFEKDYLTNENMPLQYYNPGPGNELFAVTDTIQDFTYLYDDQGNLINSRPLESVREISLLHFESDRFYHAYTIYGNEFSIYRFVK